MHQSAHRLSVHVKHEHCNKELLQPQMLCGSHSAQPPFQLFLHMSWIISSNPSMTILPQISVQWRFSYLFMICTELTFQKGFYVTYKNEHIVNKTSRIKKQLKVLEKNVYSHTILPVLAPPYPCHCSSPGNWKGINEIDEFENQ